MRHPSVALLVVILVPIMLISTLLAGEGALTSDLIEQIRSSYEMDTHTRAMYNAITNSDIKELALNRDILNQHNEVFSHKIKAKGITNQKSSGRCWLFAGLNIMRPAVIEKYKLSSFEFSQNYVAFWDKMEKANTYLERIIEFRDRDLLDREMEIILRSPFPDGGWWKYIVDLIEKHGLVPKEIMPETHSSESTGMMNRIIGRKLRIDAVRLRKMYSESRSVEELRGEKASMLAEIYKMLSINLGEPPVEFPWRFEDRDSVVSKTEMYTPIRFYKEFVNVDLQEYMNIFNDPTKDFNKYYTISLTRNIYDADNVSYANVDIDVLKELAMESVLDDEPVWFACDVGKDQSKQYGIMAIGVYDYGSIYDTDLAMTKAERSMFRESAPNHAMVFVGVDVKDDKPVKWLVENSWGTGKGSSGYWTLYDTWFDNHVYNVIVNKKYLPKEILRIFEQDPIVIPPWDPVCSFVR